MARFAIHTGKVLLLSGVQYKYAIKEKGFQYAFS